MVGACFAAQVQAAEHHRALQQADIAVQDSAEFQHFEAEVIADLTKFLQSVRPNPDRDPAFLARHCWLIVIGVCEQLAQRELAGDELAQHLAATSCMLADYLGL